jgi:hypothetical protein
LETGLTSLEQDSPTLGTLSTMLEEARPVLENLHLISEWHFPISVKASPALDEVFPTLANHFPMSGNDFMILGNPYPILEKTFPNMGNHLPNWEIPIPRQNRVQIIYAGFT